MKNKCKVYPFVICNKPNKSTHSDYINNQGWGNGYVAVPKEHPLYGYHYSDYIKVKNLENIPFNKNYLGLIIFGSNDKKEENTLPLDLFINVNCGLTCSRKMTDFIFNQAKFLDRKRPKGDYWIFGFDTSHLDDNPCNWNKKNVIKETLKLKKILKEFKLTK